VCCSRNDGLIANKGGRRVPYPSPEKTAHRYDLLRTPAVTRIRDYYPNPWGGKRPAPSSQQALKGGLGEIIDRANGSRKSGGGGANQGFPHARRLGEGRYYNSRTGGHDISPS